MPETGSAPLDFAELDRRLRAVEPAVVLTPPRVLRRIIKYDRKLPGMGLLVPHRKSYVIRRDIALAVADRDELLVDDGRQLPETLILLARPDDDKLEQCPAGVMLFLSWRLLFHARVHMVLAARLAADLSTRAHSCERAMPGEIAALRRRICQIGFTEFDEIRTVLRQEYFLLPPGDDRVAYEEFGAIYLELREFAPMLVPRYFPALQDLNRIDALLAQDVNCRELFDSTRPEGAPQPSAFAAQETARAEPPVEDAGTAAAAAIAARPSEMRLRYYLRQADRALARGNVVRSAIQRERAALVSSPDRAPGIRADARTDLERLVARLQPALEFEDRAIDEWRRALPPLLAPAAQGVWTIEARLLYDLQKVCVEQERGVSSVDVFEWLRAFGQRPLKRPLTGVREVRTVKHLRKARRRLRSARLTDEVRQLLASLLQAAIRYSELKVRTHFRPVVQEALRNVGLLPQNLPERVAWQKLTEELLDRVNERGLLTMGDLRDAVSRNQIKVPDLSGAAELVHGDCLLRANRKLAVCLEGTYRRGEIYLRGLQRLSALAFGTAPGRWLVRFLLLPFGGAFMALFAVEEILGLLARLRAASPAAGDAAAEPVAAAHHVHGPHLANAYSVGFLGVFLLLLLHLPPFRRKIVDGIMLLGRAGKAVFIDLPAAIAQLSWLQRFLHSWPIVLFHHYVVRPLVFTVLVASICALVDAEPMTTAVYGLLAFLTATLWFNTRLGRQFEEAFTDWYVRGWRYLWLEFLPGLVRLSLEVFKRGLEAIERLLYTVDEWLRFRQGESRLALIIKALLGVIWAIITYLIRVILNLFVEPTFNPIKHFPTVTVAAKLVTPMMLVMRPQMVQAIEPFLGAWLANGVVVLIIGLVPGFAGFLVWEFKENWKMYAANRPQHLHPVLIGHHGETMLRFLKPGFHSGTIPRLYAKMRRANRWAQKTGDWRAFRKHRDSLHHIRESLHRFFEREFLALLEESRCWQVPPVTVDVILPASNRIQVALGCADLSDQDLVLGFEERSGWLLAQVAAPGWLSRLHNEQRRVLVNALIGLDKMAGVHLVREQIESSMPPDIAYDVTDRGLTIWPRDSFDAEAVYDLNAEPLLTPRVHFGSFAVALPAVPATPFVFSKSPVSWSHWVGIWEKDQSCVGHPKAVIHGARMMPEEEHTSKRGCG